MSRWWRVALAVIFAAYAVLLLRNTSLAAGGPDESGYMNEARMIASGKLRLEVTSLAVLGLDASWLPVFTPLGFNSVGERSIVPAYPPGLPIHLLIAGHYASPLLALGCLVLTYALGRELGLQPVYALAAAAILAVTPQFILFALQVMSDVPATFWALAAIVLALKSARRPIAAVLIAAMIYVPWTSASRYRVLRIDDHQSVYTGAMLWSAPLIPEKAMVVSGLLSGAFLLYQNRFTARWDNLDAARFEVIRGRARWYAVISEVEVDMAEFRRRLPGNWILVAKYRNVTLYRLD